MSYRVVIPDRIRERIAGWHMPDFLLVDIYQHLLGDRLSRSPTSCLRRVRSPFDGMVYEFDLIDPNNELCRHQFLFRLVYGQDEQTLIVVNGGYFPEYLA